MMEKRERVSKPSLLIFCFFSLFVLLILIAPIMQSTGSLTDLSGMTIIIDNCEIWTEMDQPWQSIYVVGDVLCHTKADRSFYLDQNQLPFCARCIAIWIGLTAGLGLMIFYQLKNNFLFFTCFLLSVGLLGLDGIGQLIGLWESSNIIRVITGVLVGIFSGFALGLIIDELNELKKKERKNERFME